MPRYYQWVGGVAGVWLSTTVSAFSLPDWSPTLALDHTLVQTSLLTRHFDPDPDHINQQQLASIELHNPDRWLTGAAWFKNSFDQPTWYFYVGREFPLWQFSEGVKIRAKLTGGLLRGYKGEYRDKIPLNHFEIAPALLPSIGVQWGRVESDLIIFGTAGMMVTAGLRF
ncbi:hypothetical protein ELY33_00050 [Vreelandella andesensis]|uniref:Sn-glycerol-3-phosphate transporter n=1 Tax=Vreelandella andesensis TaxID=447567 RepID=A0A3S0YNN5_9GAMM|nr:hypothetical protein [Halomonas andesensis]RUR34933.1 hypothetical protein ELY33_00050 [Halomonas andesensis]